LERLDALPVSRRLLCEVHAVLLSDVRGRERLPGEVRRSQNWIGSPDNRPETAVFVPPDVDDMERAFDDFERFVHEETSIPPLVKIALVHYQFEMIHPFLDGNGRLGRLLIGFLLVEQQLLPQPLLYLSAYFEQYRSEYYDRLQAVRERGELREWLVFFLTGVADLANDAVGRAERLVDLRENYRQRLSGDRSRAVEVVDLVFQNPVLTTTRIAETLDTTLQSALNHVRRLESASVAPLRQLERAEQERTARLGRVDRGIPAAWRLPRPDATLSARAAFLSELRRDRSRATGPTFAGPADRAARTVARADPEHGSDQRIYA